MPPWGGKHRPSPENRTSGLALRSMDGLVEGVEVR